ncbi:hypothetical protein DLJ53_19180 [Acuticoccus sediminis]|uniref:Excisionase family DNA binding protein n=1 Tax=Acuticoccus sediminis TaxID=2184697 RepID=A0A8B2NU61_9HYPH|nr:hypothetical protein [Acuticoccus sediminis]RAH99869.1 hypothetical protein DLJ53_19180 [Acuticoccus sediminis]
MELTDNTERPVWGVKAIAEVIGLGEKATYYLVAEGKLPVKRVGKRHCAFPSALRAALRADGGEAA